MKGISDMTSLKTILNTIKHIHGVSEAQNRSYAKAIEDAHKNIDLNYVYCHYKYIDIRLIR